MEEITNEKSIKVSNGCIACLFKPCMYTHHESFLGFFKTHCHSSESWNPGENTIISIKNSWIPAYAGMTECFLKPKFQTL
jgi:hypothetical protein